MISSHINSILGKSAIDKKQSVNNTPHESTTTSVDVSADRDKNEYGTNIGREDTLWTVFHRLKAVFDVPLDDSSSHGGAFNSSADGISNHSSSGRSSRNSNGGARIHHDIIYDDSKRVVDMTEILPNLFIGDEYVHSFEF